MTPGRKLTLLILGLFLPLMAMATYFVVMVSRYPGIVLPSWYAYVVALYIGGSIVLVMVIRRSNDRRTPQEKAERTLRRARVLFMYLIAVWIACFFYGAVKTLRGEFPVKNAIRAGAIFLAFILLCTWMLYRDFKRKGR